MALAYIQDPGRIFFHQFSLPFTYYQNSLGSLSSHWFCFTKLNILTYFKTILLKLQHDIRKTGPFGENNAQENPKTFNTFPFLLPNEKSRIGMWRT